MTKARTLADNFAADINGITAGTGITGGGTSGTVTITNDMATTINAKGDLVVGTANDTYSRLAVASTAGYLLTVDSAEATGLKWGAPPSSGGMTLLKTQTLNAASTTISDISTDYKHLLVMGKNIYGSATNIYGGMYIRMNSDTASNYYSYLVRAIGGSLGAGSDGIGSIFNVTERLHTSSTDIDKMSFFETLIYRYTDTTTVNIYNRGYGYGSSGAWYESFGQYNNSAAITSVTVASNNGETLYGTVYIYGVS